MSYFICYICTLAGIATVSLVCNQERDVYSSLHLYIHLYATSIYVKQAFPILDIC